MVTEPTTAANVRHTPLAPYDGTDQQVVDTLWGAEAVFCTRCGTTGMWHHRDYHTAVRRGRMTQPPRARTTLTSRPASDD